MGYSLPMETLHLTTRVGADGSLRVDVHTTIPPGLAEVVLVVSPAPQPATQAADRIRAAEELCAMELPVAGVQEMNREATPSDTELLP